MKITKFSLASIILSCIIGAINVATIAVTAIGISQIAEIILVATNSTVTSICTFLQIPVYNAGVKSVAPVHYDLPGHMKIAEG